MNWHRCKQHLLAPMQAAYSNFVDAETNNQHRSAIFVNSRHTKTKKAGVTIAEDIFPKKPFHVVRPVRASEVKDYGFVGELQPNKLNCHGQEFDTTSQLFGVLWKRDVRGTASDNLEAAVTLNFGTVDVVIVHFFHRANLAELLRLEVVIPDLRPPTLDHALRRNFAVMKWAASGFI